MGFKPPIGYRNEREGHTYQPVYVELEGCCDTLSLHQENNQEMIELQEFILQNDVPESKYIGKRGNNERLIPTGEILADKKFSVGLWAYLQTISVCNHIDDYRYVDREDVSVFYKCELLTCLKNKDGYNQRYICTSTNRQAFKHLMNIGLIIEKVDGQEVFTGYSGSYFKLKNWNAFDFYVLLENRFLNELLFILPEEALRVYLVYYSFNKAEKQGQCILTQESILERIGYSCAAKNLEKLRFINKLLVNAP